MHAMNPHTTRGATRSAVVAILVFLIVSAAAVAVLQGSSDAPGEGIFDRIGDYFIQAGDALGND